MSYDMSVIIVKKHKAMLVPLMKCSLVEFGTRKRKPVSYKMRDYLVCEWDMDNCRRLAKAGIMVPSPALDEYTWPGPYQPYAHQRETFNFIVLTKRGFVFNDIGTGKSLSSLWAADYLMSRGEISKVLIASTLSTLDRVWNEEIWKHLMHRSCTVVHGSAQKRRRALSENKDFYIINHEGLKSELARLLEMKFDMVILDEGARFRNQKTDLWKACNELCKQEKLEYLAWMTGSPMPRAPTDAWAQAKVVNPQTVPKYFSRFRDQTMYKVTQFKYVPVKGWEDMVYSSLKPSIRFHRDDCIDLPPCQYIEHPVKMSTQQATTYANLQKNFLAELQKGLITAVNEGAKLVKLLQVACGAVYHDNGQVSLLDCKPKLDEMDAIMEETGDKVIIFVPFKNTMKVLRQHFDAKYKDLTYGIINGEVGKSKRDRIFNSFQNGKLNMIIAHPAAMAHGLTLTTSNTIVWWGPVDDYEIYEQANGRITRPGQTRHQYIKHLHCSDVESAVYDRLKNKEKMQGLLLDMIKK